jgi:hypothetical protein
MRGAHTSVIAGSNPALPIRKGKELTDYFGQELKVGDLILYPQTYNSGGASFYWGIVVEIKKSLKLLRPNWNNVPVEGWRKTYPFIIVNPAQYTQAMRDFRINNRV